MSLRPQVMRIAAIATCLGASLLLGLAGPITGRWSDPIWVAVSTTFSGGWPWVCYAFFVGYFFRTKIESALLSSLGLATGVVTYYLSKRSTPAIPEGAEIISSSAGVPFSQIAFWGAAAFVLGAPVGILGNLARTPGLGGFFFQLIVPLAAFCETSLRLSAEAESASRVAVTTWNTTRLLACVAILALATHAIWSYRKKRGLRAEAGPTARSPRGRSNMTHGGHSHTKSPSS